jgi:M6 family metalloprotease-like protein
VTQPLRRLLGRLAAVAVLGAAVLTGQQLLPPASTAQAAPAEDCRLAAPAGVGNEHEGPTDYTRWLRPQGTLRAAVLFVRFPDAAPGPSELAERTALLKPAEQWLAASSYGRVSLQLQFTTRWHLMPKPQRDYLGYATSFAAHRQYLQDAVTASDASVDFRQVELVYVVAPRSASVFKSSPAFIAGPGNGVLADGVERRHGVTFGRSLDTWGFKLVSHETGHTFGLPDLYAYGATWPGLHAAVGGWDLMGLISGPAPDHLAWHKWKLGWLGDTQVSCQTGPGLVSQTLTPLGTAGGLKAIVAKTGPQRAVVVENRQVSALDRSSSCFRPGVLVYVVDSSVGGGGNPVRVIDHRPGSAVAGCSAGDAELDDATLTSINHQVVDAASGVRIRLTGASGGNRTVHITWLPRQRRSVGAPG